MVKVCLPDDGRIVTNFLDNLSQKRIEVSDSAGSPVRVVHVNAELYIRGIEVDPSAACRGSGDDLLTVA
jgi:hypothetical protein